MGKYDSMSPELKAYAEEKIRESGVRMVPGHYPVFESKDHVDAWIKMTKYALNDALMEKSEERKMIIQIDSREKDRAIKKIVAEFDRQGIKHPVSKLMVGDYMNYDNPRLIIDRKQNLTELCSNVCQDHDRFRRELCLAQENDIQLVILVEHGHGITDLSHVQWWDNPRRFERVQHPVTGRWMTVETKAMKGEILYKILCTQERKYGVQFRFCDKSETGSEIIRILRDGL